MKTFKISHCCVIKQKEFPGTNKAVTVLDFQSSFLLVICFSYSRGLYRRLDISNNCVVRENEFSKKVEMSRIQYIYWNRLSNKSFSFESEQFLRCVWG